VITPNRASEWFTPTSNRTISGELTGGETGSTPPPPACAEYTHDTGAPVPCRHEMDNESLRGWLSRLPGDATVTVDEVLMRLGRKVVA
jgi:hypothetical protein